jgi:16S rRNA (adenine1518-N6/adenine1519-N6)-dimethyltransferase
MKMKASEKINGAQPSIHGIWLKKSRSQIFLQDEQVLEAEAYALDAKGQSVLEIGAGDGRLSQKILLHDPSSLYLVEPDPRWAGYLAKKFSKNPKVNVLNLDFLSISDDFPASRIAGNIPYHLTSKILLKLEKMKFSKAVLCLQKEVAQRMIAKAGSHEYGRLSVFVQLHFDVQLLLEVPRNSFYPIPKVDSAVVCLTPSKNAPKLAKSIDLLTAALFSHRLKTLGQAIFHERRRWGWSKEQARKWAKELKISNKRVFELSAAEVAELAEILPPIRS